MTVKQISVFVENKAGKLAEFTRVLWKYQIDMRALTLADTRDFGMMRIIVNDPNETVNILQKEGYVFSITRVLAVAVPDEPGSLNKIITLLGEHGINIEYTYAFNHRLKNVSCVIFRVEDTELAASVLAEGGFEVISQERLKEI